MLEIESNYLFDPIVIQQTHLDLTDDFIKGVKNWCMKKGDYDKDHCFTTTYTTGLQAHDVDWIYDVIMHIAPKDQFVESWVQVYDVGGYHPPHNHNGDFVRLSGCLYLNKGPSTHFQNPLHPDQIASNHLITAGDVLLWDPALYHFSPPVKDERAILAFNLR